MLGVRVSAWLVAEAAPLPSMQSLFLQLGLSEMLLQPRAVEGGMGLPRNQPPCLFGPRKQDLAPAARSDLLPPAQHLQGRRRSHVSSHQHNSNTASNFPLIAERGDKDTNWHRWDYFFSPF